jgi:hypothetical protein
MAYKSERNGQSNDLSNFMLGMFFLREHEAQMKDGDLYIQANAQDEVMVPFIEPRASLSFDDVNDEL